MGAARESRQSEKTMTSIWALLPHLMVCLWYPLYEDVLEYIKEIRVRLDELERQVIEERSPSQKPKP